MIYGIGIDIIEIERIQKAIQKYSFLKRTFTQYEIQYYQKKGCHAETLSGLFAAKEAVSKAISTGFRSFSPIDIEIQHNEQNKPSVNLSPKLQEILQQMHIANYEFFISISHCKDYAIAFVVLYTAQKGFQIS